MGVWTHRMQSLRHAMTEHAPMGIPAIGAFPLPLRPLAGKMRKLSSCLSFFPSVMSPRAGKILDPPAAGIGASSRAKMAGGQSSQSPADGTQRADGAGREDSGSGGGGMSKSTFNMMLRMQRRPDFMDDEAKRRWRQDMDAFTQHRLFRAERRPWCVLLPEIRLLWRCHCANHTPSPRS